MFHAPSRSSSREVGQNLVHHSIAQADFRIRQRQTCAALYNLQVLHHVSGACIDGQSPGCVRDTQVLNHEIGVGRCPVEIKGGGRVIRAARVSSRAGDIFTDRIFVLRNHYHGPVTVPEPCNRRIHRESAAHPLSAPPRSKNPALPVLPIVWPPTHLPRFPKLDRTPCLTPSPFD